jgi:hypothetical protein
MHVVYFAHPYRDADALLVDHFGRLLRSEHLVLRLDPPSDDVNAAKLERQLGACDGMVVLLTQRDDGVSPHIMFEMTMCLRSRKPLLIFVEDTLSGTAVPQRLLQRRFSRRSHLREVREHRHAVGIFKHYLGDQPKYQPTTGRRNCLFVGLEALPTAVRREMLEFVHSRGYDSHGSADLQDDLVLFEAIASAHLLVQYVDHADPFAHEVAGAARAALLPHIALTGNRHFPYSSHVPKQYQPVFVDEPRKAIPVLSHEFDLFEEDFIDLMDQQQVDTYRRLLVDNSSSTGAYDSETRRVFINKLVMHDLYEGNTGIVGAGAQVVAATIEFQQLWEEHRDEVDLKKLAQEIMKISESHEAQAEARKDPGFLNSVNAALHAALSGDGPKTLEHLAGAGAGAFKIAKTLGLEVAAKIIAESMKFRS